MRIVRGAAEAVLLQSARQGWGGSLHRLSLAGGRVQRVTPDSVTDAALASDGRTVVYLTPASDLAGGHCIKELDVVPTRVVRTLCAPAAGFTFGPGAIRLSPDGQYVAAPVRLAGTQQTINIAVIRLADTSNAAPRLVFAKESRRTVGFQGWPRMGELRYWAETGSGFAVHALDPLRGESVAVREEVPGVRVQVGARSLVLETVTTRDTIGTTLRIRDAATGAVIGSWFSPAPFMIRPWGIDGAASDRVFATFMSATEPLRADELTVTLSGDAPAVQLRPILRPSSALQQLLARCRVSRVTFPTWDDDPKTGSRRLLSGYLYEPAFPMPPSQRRAVITSFYGGGEVYGTIFKVDGFVHCALGVTFFSPAIRDMRGPGDNVLTSLAPADPFVGEIRDLYHAARFLERRAGFTASQIGVSGGSQGGGIVMRAMTVLAAGVGVPAAERYQFGFGIAQSPGDKRAVLDPTHRFYHRDSSFFATVMGDKAELQRRLPFARMDLLSRPVFVFQGTDDPTVPIAETRKHVADARALGRPIELLELPGEGHGFGRRRSHIQAFQAQFDFIQRVSGVSRPHVGGVDRVRRD
jgi:dienelactone hydrolase